MRIKTNWNTPSRLSFFSEAKASPESAPRQTTPKQTLPTPPAKKPAPVKTAPVKPKAPSTKKAAPSSVSAMDAMLQSIDGDLALCGKTPDRLRIACLFPDHPFYTKLKSAIAAHIGDIVGEEKASLLLTLERKDVSIEQIQILSPEDYTPEKKRELWDLLKEKARGK